MLELKIRVLGMSSKPQTSTPITAAGSHQQPAADNTMLHWQDRLLHNQMLTAFMLERPPHCFCAPCALLC
jgi:hypothetical protein